MTDTVLHYIHYPLCGWCYAAAPLVEAAASAGIPVVLYGGGLWDTATRLDPGKREHIRRSDVRIAELTGVVFGAAYFDGLLLDEDTRFWSRLTIVALLAARAVAPGAELRMMRAIQHAQYVEGRPVIETAVLSAAAVSIGLPARAFGRAFEAAAVDDHIAETRRWMRLADLRGFPGFLIGRGADVVRFQHETFYGDPIAFLRAIESLGMDAAVA